VIGSVVWYGFKPTSMCVWPLLGGSVGSLVGCIGNSMGFAVECKLVWVGCRCLWPGKRWKLVVLV
jgi:hypothetical protein